MEKNWHHRNRRLQGWFCSGRAHTWGNKAQLQPLHPLTPAHRRRGGGGRKKERGNRKGNIRIKIKNIKGQKKY